MKVRKIKQNKNTPAVRVAAATLAAFVLLISLAVPSFAYTDTSSNGIDFEDQPIPLLSSPTIQQLVDSGLYVGHKVNSNTDRNQRYYCAASTDSVYVFLLDGTNYNVCFVSDNAFTGYELSYRYSDPNYVYNTVTTFSASYNSDYGKYYAAWNIGLPSSFDDIAIPLFTSVQDGIDAIEDWIENPPSPDPGTLTGEFSYSLPAGNVIFIDVTNLNVAVDLTQTTPLSYWGLGATQYSGVTSSLPSSLELPIPGTSIINWTGSGKSDSFGKYSNWVSHATVSGIASDHNHVYYVVANPLNNNSTAGTGYDVSAIANGNIGIHVSNSNSVKIYQLETSFNAGVYDSNSAGDTMTGHNDGSGGLTFTNDSTGDPDNPSFGGMTTPESQSSTIHDFLQNIATQISGFFSGAIGAVSTLVSAGKDFMQSVSALYMWLPGPVYTVLTSAIILVITIGVIKVFI